MNEYREQLEIESVSCLVISTAALILLGKHWIILFLVARLRLMDYIFIGAFFSLGIIDPLRCLFGGVNLKLHSGLLVFYCIVGSFLACSSLGGMESLGFFMDAFVFISSVVVVYFLLVLERVFKVRIFNRYKNNTSEQDKQNALQEKIDSSIPNNMGFLSFLWRAKEGIFLIAYVLYCLKDKAH